MRFITFLFLALLGAQVGLASARHPRRRRLRISPCVRAFRQCDWEFRGLEGKIPTFRLNPQDEALTPQVVSKNSRVRIGVLNMNYLSPEFILRSGKVVPIKKIGLTPNHFKPYTIPRIMGSGVGHETFQRGQMAIASGRCVRVFFTTFQLFVGAYPPDVRNINVGREDYKCVVFRTKKH